MKSETKRFRKLSKRLALLIVSAIHSYAQPSPPPTRIPTLPLSVPTAVPPIITRTVTVSDGQDFQSALNGATPGTNIVCSGTFIGNFYMPGISDVEISGTCTLQSPNTYPALMNISATEGFGWSGNVADRAAKDWWITGITITSSGPIYHAVVISDDCDPEPAGMPSGITFSGVTVNGLRMTDGQQNGMLLDGANISVINSQITQWQSSGVLLPEANAIEIICGTGPYLFRGNTLSASSEDFLIAAPGASPIVPSSQIIPSDITFMGNTLTKDLGWIGTPYGADKNCWESKNSERVLITGNRIQNCFPGSQMGEGIALTPRIGLGNPVQYFSQVSDTTITRNTIQAGVGVSISGMDNYCTPQMACVFSARTLVSGNIVTASTAPNGVPGTYGWCVQIDQAQELSVRSMSCTTDGMQSVFVDTFPCVHCSISKSTFNADFGGQGVVGPAALFRKAVTDPFLANSITDVAISGITPAVFQSEWTHVCATCVLK